MLRTLRHPVKILGDGEIEVALTVHAHRFSASARKKIEAAGGSVVVIGGEDVPAEPVRDPVKRAAAEARAAAEPAKPVVDDDDDDDDEPAEAVAESDEPAAEESTEGDEA